MPQFTYNFSDPAGSSFTVTTEDNTRIFTTAGGKQAEGYAITGISGTFNGQQITGLIAPAGFNQIDSGANGGGDAGPFNNVIFINDTQAEGAVSYKGIDSNGVGFRTATTDYAVYTDVDTFNYQANGSSAPATLSSTNAPCFVTGTLIRTTRGEVAVEDLTVDDVAETASGEHRPIRWIGHRTTDCNRHPDPAEVLPVRISAGALGERRPERDLLVSPGHAICLDVLGEVLIPAHALVNGTTITRVNVDEVTYWHVELDSHDILVANGQPAESYLDMGNRAFFAESDAVDLSSLPDADLAARTHADFCRPFHADGVLVDAVRAQLRRRAEALGWRLEQSDTWLGVHLEVDGRLVAPKARGLSACFEVPADARDVWLVSPTSVPCYLEDNSDSRTLGLSLTGLRLDDGLHDAKVVALDDALLNEGFHANASDHRWTAGRARLPAALFAGLEGTAFLRVDLGALALPRWTFAEAIVETPEPQPEGLRLAEAA